MYNHRQPKLILRNLQNVGHYKTLYWGFAHFLKIIEYCYYCGNKVYLPSVHLVLVCCAQFERDSRSIRGRKSRGKILKFSPSIFSLEYSSNRAQTAHNTQVQGELKVGKLYLHNNSSILRFLRNGQIPNKKSYNGLHFASFAI